MKFRIYPRCFFVKLTKNKGIEIECVKDIKWINYFNFNMAINRRVDHAGMEVLIEICGIIFNAKFYDFRHWDSDNECWEIYKD